MAQGNAPKIKAKVRVNKTGAIETRDIHYELHHTNTPRRVGGPNVHNNGNLTEVDPWQHADIDPYRHPGIEFLEVIKGTNSW